MSDETKASATVSDYLRWRGDLTFAQDGFNEVDNLLLCIISYIKLENIPRLRSFDPQDAMPMGDVCRLLTEEDEQLGLSTLDYIPLMRQAAETPRFREVSLFAFESLHDEDRQMQFAAVSFLLPDGSVYAAYRGTDMTIVGWQEDFNMSFLSAVPAQVKAAEYAGAVARACPRRPLRIGGHSKGGNLAAWAAVHLDEKLQRQRLIAAYNNDGPGFSRDLVDTPSYQAVADRLFTYIPASSIVGVLLEHAEDYAVIDSSNRSIMQHEPMSWNVEGPRFVHLGQRSPMGKVSDDLLRQWIGSMTPQEREQFTDALFDILSMSGKTRTLEDLRAGGLAKMAALLKQYSGADEKDKKIITEIFRRLASDVKGEMKKAVECGYWQLWRYNPDNEAQGQNPFMLDSKEPDWSKFEDFLKGEVRFASVLKQYPDEAAELFRAARDNARWRYNNYVRLTKQSWGMDPEITKEEENLRK